MSLGIRLVTTSAAAAALLCIFAGSAESGQAPQTVSPSLPVPASDAQLNAERMTSKLKNADIDLTVPESPAFIAINLSPDTVIRPTTPREFATGVLNGVDRSGNLQTGIALDAVPYLIYAGSTVSLQEYRDSTVTQILSRTQASFATTKGGGDDDPSVKLAVGVHSTLFDSEDPRLNNDALLQCFSAIPVLRVTDLGITLSDEERERRLELARQQFEQDTLRPRTEACREQFRRTARWNGTSWIVAAATMWVSPTGRAGDLDERSSSFWTSFSYGFDGVPGLRDNAQLIGHLRHISNEFVVDADLPGGNELRDSTIAGVRLRAGTSSFGLSFEAAYVRTTPETRAQDTSTRLSFVAERRLAANLWLNVSFSGDSGAEPETTQGLSVLSAFKYAFTKDPSLNATQR